MTGYRLIATEARGGATVVSVLEPQLTTHVVAEMLESELLHVVHELRPAIFVLDFEQVRMISSATIGVLLRVRQRLLEQGGQLRLCRVNVPISEVYRVLNLDQNLLLVFDTVEQAVKAQVVESSEPREVWED